MPRLIVPSSGGGTKLTRIFRAGALGDGDGDGDSCAASGSITSKAQKTSPILFVRRRSNIATPIDVRENVVAPFTVGQKSFVHLPSHELIIQPVEPQQMIGDSFCCVMFRGPGLDQKCPVARLGQE